ncbi:MAG TPA: XkdF-like putative serine protease domain-containing protein [Polyangia bacterium]|nr:XkdF-like putative serine protease domain-containing protein [Polyangia bacterium]
MDLERFEKRAEILKLDDSLGVVYGWAFKSQSGGADYYDLHGDHITQEAAESAALDFMLNSRASTDLHANEDGVVPFLMPITDDTVKGFGIETQDRGVVIGMRPSPGVYGKFKSGEYTGFSIGGTRVEEEVVEKWRDADLAKLGEIDRDADLEKLTGEALALYPTDGEAKSAAATAFAKAGGDAHGFRQGRRRRMTKFTLREIAAVDAGAQEGALAVLMKRRAESQDDDEPESRRTRKDDPMTDSEKRRLERLEKLLTLPHAEQEFAKALKTDKVRDAFLAKSDEDRAAEVAAEIEKRDDADPVVFTSMGGRSYRKSADPELVELAKARDADQVRIAKLEKSAEDATLARRAAEELPHLPGTVEERAKLLRAVDGIDDEADRETALKALRAGDAAIAKAFRTTGVSPDDIDKLATDDDALEKRAGEILKTARESGDNHMTEADAYGAAMAEIPDPTRH